MSLFISVADHEAIYLATDAAGYDPFGTAQIKSTRVTIAQKVPVAITWRGNQRLGSILTKKFVAVADARGVDAYISSFIIAAATPMMAANPKYSGADHLHWHVCAWSPTVGAVRLSFHNLPSAFSDGEKPGAAHKVEGVYAAGTEVPAGAIAEIRKRRPGEPLGDHFRAVVPSIFEAWREAPEAQHLVGGHIDLTTIDAAGARTETIHHWPDRVGEPISAG